MNKANVNEIKDFYSQGEVVKSYDITRFGGLGGRYINDSEVNPNIELLKERFGENKKIKVLDLGAGRGRLSGPIKKSGFDIYCLDSSNEMVKYLKKTVSAKNIFIQSAFDKVKTPTRFDAITALRFFDHFKLNDQKKILLNVKKSMKKNGVVVFSALNKNGIESLLSRFFYFGKVNYFYSDEDFRKMFASCGFNVLSRKQKFFFPRGVFLKTQKNYFIGRASISFDSFLSKVFPNSCSYFVYLLERK